MKRRGPADSLAVLSVVSLMIGLGGAYSGNGASAAEKSAIPELEILRDQKVSIADLHEVPITEASANVYVITDEDIRQSGATDIPTLLRRIPGMEIMTMTGADINVSVRGNNQVTANKLLVLVDGRPTGTISA